MKLPLKFTRCVFHTLSLPANCSSFLILNHESRSCLIKRTRLYQDVHWNFITWHWSPRLLRSLFALPAVEDSLKDSRRSSPSSACLHPRRLSQDSDCSCLAMFALENLRLLATLSLCYSSISFADFGTKSSPANYIRNSKHVHFGWWCTTYFNNVTFEWQKIR